MFKCKEVCVGVESYDFHFWEIIPCLCILFGDLRFSNDLAFTPECHYQDVNHTMQVFSEMYTGKWWWSVQVRPKQRLIYFLRYSHCLQKTLESHKPGVTVIPIIILSDKTQLTQFQSKSAYPVYLTISNIPKAICNKPNQHAQLLMGYIPTTRLKNIKNKAARRRALVNLFHSCMRKLLSPIESYGETGIAMSTGNGIWYHCHPILAMFIGDYLEQTLVTCTLNGRCPKCLVP